MIDDDNSYYNGDIKCEWEHGKGEYVYPNGVKYVGEFSKGQFHGEGILYYPNKGYFKGIWKDGKLQSGEYFFFDGLKYEKENWDYCQNEDRRFNYERNNGINPSGKTLLTNNPKGEKKIPEGTYDIGDGYFEPIKCLIYNYEGTEIIRIPKEEEILWIREKCRYNPRLDHIDIDGKKDKVITRIVELMRENNK